MEAIISTAAASLAQEGKGPVAASFPALAVYHSPHGRHDRHPGWSLVLPPGWVRPVWQVGEGSQHKRRVL